MLLHEAMLVEVVSEFKERSGLEPSTKEMVQLVKIANEKHDEIVDAIMALWHDNGNQGC